MVNRGIFRVPPESSGGGAEKQGYHLANHLAKLGNDVHFVGKVRKGAEFNSRVIVYRAPPSRGVIPPRTSLFGWVLKHLFGNILSTFVALRVLAKSPNPFDIVHCHGALAALLLEKIIGSKVPVLYTMHDASPWIVSYPGILEGAFRKLVYLTVDVPCLRSVCRVIAVSPALRDEARRWGVAASEVTFIPNAVATPSLSRSNLVPRVRYGLFVGQLVHRKNVDLLVQAAKSLSNQNVRFIVIGEGPARLSLIELARRLGVDDKISFMGYVSDEVLSNYYRGASFFVFPSLAEGLSLSLFEAMSFGLPAIVARLNVYEGLLQDGVNCLLFNRRDVVELENLIRRIITDHNFALRISRNAASLVKARFSWDAVGRQVLSLYEDVKCSRD
jgi:glycogen(starch) synthase